MNAPKSTGKASTAKAVRLAGTLCLALLLSGCVIVPYDPWHPHRYGYWR